MASREEALEAENGRLQSEMASLKKKIMLALKKQQAELQAKIQAAEQRAAAAEAAVSCANSSSPSSEEARSEVEVNSVSNGGEDSSGGGGEEIDRIRKELLELQGSLEDERMKKTELESALSEQLNQGRQRIEELSKANEKMETQLVSAAQQVSDTFSRVAEMQETMEILAKERDSVKIANEKLSLEHERLVKEVQAAKEDAGFKAKEMQEMLASHKATQEGQEAAMAHLMQQMQMQASSNIALSSSFAQTESIKTEESQSGSDENGMIEELKKIIAALEKEVADLRADALQPKEISSREESDQLATSSDEVAEAARRSLEAELSAAQQQMQNISQEHQDAAARFENQLKERDDKYAELDLKFNRLQKRAKQRIQEVQKEKDDVAMQLSASQAKEQEAVAKHATLQSELERFRAQAGDAIRALDAERQSLRNTNAKLKEELDDVRRNVSARELDIGELRKLVSEKEQSILSMHAETREAQQKQGSLLSEMEDKNKKIVDSLQAQLQEAGTEKNKLAGTILTLQALLVEKESKLTDVEATLSGQIARLSASMEAEKREAEQLQKHQENERQRWQENANELQNKIELLEQECDQLQSELAMSKRQKEIELDSQRQLLTDAQRETAMARDEVARLNKEFTSYKQRAHALLQKKEAELQAAKDADLAAAQEETLKDAQKQAAVAAAERDRAVNALKQAVSEFETQLAARNVAVVDAEERIKDFATKLEGMKGRLAYEREEWSKQSREQELAWQDKYEELAKKQKNPANEAVKAELSSLRAEYERMKDEFVSFRDMATNMMEAKDKEINKLLDDNDSLQKKLNALPQENSIKTEPRQQDTAQPVVAVAEQQILLLARQQAQREEELKQSQREIQVLQEELSDLEHENRLRSQQEALLKNELRNMERAARRENVDMTYLKNVILKLLQTGEVEALLPVVGTLLQFSPEEIKRCQELYAAAAAEAPVSTPRILFSRLSFATTK